MNNISVKGQSQNNNLVNKTYSCCVCVDVGRFNMTVKLKNVETLETVDDKDIREICSFRIRTIRMEAPLSDEGPGSENYFSQTIDSLKNLCRPSDVWPGRRFSDTETFWRSFSSRFQENELLIALILCHAWTIVRNWAHSHYSIIYGRQWAVNELSILNGIDIEQDSCMRN